MAMLVIDAGVTSLVHYTDDSLVKMYNIATSVAHTHNKLAILLLALD